MHVLRAAPSESAHHKSSGPPARHRYPTARSPPLFTTMQHMAAAQCRCSPGFTHIMAIRPRLTRYKQPMTLQARLTARGHRQQQQQQLTHGTNAPPCVDLHRWQKPAPLRHTSRRTQGQKGAAASGRRAPAMWRHEVPPHHFTHKRTRQTNQPCNRHGLPYCRLSPPPHALLHANASCMLCLCAASARASLLQPAAPIMHLCLPDKVFMRSHRPAQLFGSPPPPCAPHMPAAATTACPLVQPESMCVSARAWMHACSQQRSLRRAKKKAPGNAGLLPGSSGAMQVGP